MPQLRNILLLVIPFATACKPPVMLTPPPAAAPAAEVALSGASVMLGAGDIAGCSSGLDRLTANVMDSVLKADSVAKVNDAAFTLGDNAYMEGTEVQFNTCFGQTWGSPTRRIMARIHPSPGNHEYYTVGANPYYKYFGASAGPAGKGYYSYDLGEWHVVVLNSEMVVNTGFSIGDRKAQEDWLISDLKAKSKPCTLAYWHHPRFSSGYHGSDVSLQPLWQILYDNNVDLIMNGHDHDYERFKPQTPQGVIDTARGIPEIVAGTGGEELRGFGGKVIRNSVYQIEGRAGVLKLTLGKAEYRAAFIESNGRVWDPSGGKCH